MQRYDGAILALSILLLIISIVGCSSDKPASTPPPDPALVAVQQENAALKARLEALETLCKPFLLPEGLEATKTIQNASQAALQAQQQASSLGTQLNSIAAQTVSVKQQADTLTQALNTAAAADKIKALQDQIGSIQATIVQMQATVIATDKKVSGIKIDNALYTMPKKWCKCSAGE